MFTRSLIHTTAMTGMVALVPLCLAVPADAGVKIKIKPQTHVNVNVKPKVKVAPKVKLGAAKIRIKTKPKASKQIAQDPTKKEQTTARINATQPKVVKEPKINTTQQFTVTANLAAGNAFEPPVPTQRPGYAVEFPADNGLEGFDELGHARAAAEASRMLDEMQQLAALGSLRDAATVNSEDNGLGIAREPGVSNRDWLGTPNTGTGGGMFDDYRGPGADEFNGMDNTHSSGPANSNHLSTVNAAQDFWRVSPGKIAAGIGNIASSSGGANPNDVTDFESRTDGTTQTNVYRYERSDGSKVTEIVVLRIGDAGITEHSSSTTTEETVIVTTPDGETVVSETSEFADSDFGDPVESYVYNTRIVSSNSEEVVEYSGSGTRIVEADDEVAELRDPDSGYAGPSPFPWINEREKPTADLTVAGNGKTPGVLTEGPGSAQVPQGNTQAAVTTDDVLENWDEDSRHRGAPQPFDGCFHSEC